MLSLIGFLNGLTAALVVIFSAAFATIVLIKNRNSQGSSLLPSAALMGLFAGLLWLGPATDFFTILLTGDNLDNSYGLYGLLSYMWVGPAFIYAMLLGTGVTMPQKKTTVLIISIIIVIIFEFLLFTSTDSVFIFHYPSESGTDLIDSNFVYGSIPFILIAVFLGFVFIFCGMGTLIMSTKGTGMIRKKFFSLSIGFNLFIVVAIFDALFAPSFILYVVRLGMVACAIFLYYGVRK